MSWEIIFWLIAMVVFIVSEAITPAKLVSIWFALGALGALIVALMGSDMSSQMIVFLVLGVVGIWGTPNELH